MTGEGSAVPLVLPGADDTIVAIATPPGRGALAVLRVSGRDAYAVASRVLTPWRAEARRAYLASLCDPATGRVIDRPVVTVYAGPRSYTGEDLVEVSVHGGAVVPALALGAMLAAGAREALPGEFTRRAVANGKMDLLQAEAIADLVDAQSRAMHSVAVDQLEGSLSRRIASLRESLLQLEAMIAYDIDFPDEDDGPISRSEVAAAAERVIGALDALLGTAHTGEVVRRGAVVVIAGAPNAGKSSLFNALVGSTRAIVTDVPGTTRDAIEAVLDVGAWPVRLVDTAGLREASDVVERLGIEVSERYLRGADVVLACGDDDAQLAETIQRVEQLSPAAIIPVRTKCDIVSIGSYSSAGYGDSRGAELVADRYQSTGGRRGPPVHVSAATGAGLGELTGV
ncbi:MAG: tRNA uridine-5-carboxymethylaminomethyl(34) synthesis GTPase MnmE, partial [Gemmatimonadaceae bacterium]|nr:tRNA uridine-5-carboxymethylaminomethyl(34) synthesis GTPase MnmE [Gemmatimonadaceae bacterium]